MRAIGVLVFVDQDELESAVISLPHLTTRFQQAHRLQQQIVKVERIRLAQFLAIDLVDVRYTLGLGVGGLQVDLLRIQHVVLCPGDARQHITRRHQLVINAEALHRLLHDGLLVGFVIDGKLPCVTRISYA